MFRRLLKQSGVVLYEPTYAASLPRYWRNAFDGQAHAVRTNAQEVGPARKIILGEVLGVYMRIEPSIHRTCMLTNR